MMSAVRVRRLVVVVCAALVAFAIGYVVARPHGGSTPAATPAPPRPTVPAALAAATARPGATPSASATSSATSSDPAGPGTSTDQSATHSDTAPGSTAESSATASSSAPLPSPAQVRRALPSLAGNPSIGSQVLARVVDVATGTVLYDDHGDTPAPPASTGKLLTAAALLAVRPATYRFTTRIVSAGAGTIVLVGGGDPTLSADPPGKPTFYPGAARISDLAAQVRASGVPVRRIVVDDSLFPGPSVAPSWDPNDMGTSYGAPITAVMADAAQTGADGTARSGYPDLTAGGDLAAALGKPKLPVERGTAPAGAKTIATVHSATIAQLLPEMLLESDNVIADVLARQVAVAEHDPASFAGATSSIRTVLARLGVPVGAGMRDGSGLSSADRVSPATLVGVLRLVGGAVPAAGGPASGGPAAAAPLHLIASDLPVAGWSGTLADRYVLGTERFAAGRVRAKTGTLSTVSAVAGLVRDRSGRLLAFDFDADHVIGTDGAEAGLDTLVSALAHL